MSTVTLNLKPQQFLVFYEFLWNLRLGDTSKFEGTMSDLAGQLEAAGADEYVAEFQEFYGRPEIGVIADNDGVVFTVK